VVRANSGPLPLQRNLILALLLTLAAASWVVLVWQATSMDMAAMGPTMGMTAPLFLTVWVVMMVAMMFPTAAPMILTFHRLQAGKRERGESFVATWVFVAAYLAVWTLFGVLAYLGATAAQALATSWSPGVAARVGGVILILAGIYQLSPLKNLCLSKCRTPLTFIMTAWKDGVGGAVRMGLEHGAYCLGCCWLLFVMLFPLGIMNVAAMAVITLLIFAEKTLPMGRRVSQGAAAALIIYGAVVLAVPEVLPTFMASGSTPMTDMPMPANPMPEMQMPIPSAPGGSPPMPAGSMPGM
jgi:predicted metal-binding membrane protein